jgi:NAD(P)-dependent dehydrogenase (short-subunit alcohol dehydrogenase family)
MAVALVTGASRGFGYALARALSQRGWHLVVDARSATDLARTAGDLDRAGRPGGTVHAVAGDVADPAHRADLVRAVEGLGRLDLLVNNASALGPSPLPPLADFPGDELERVFRVNALAPLALARAVLPHLAASRGTVVNVSSDAAVEAYAGWGGYGASKAALDQLTAVLGVEQPALRVYGFDPGDMRTEMHQRAFPGEDISDRPPPETVVPALLHLLDTRPPSGRYRAGDLLTALSSAGPAAGHAEVPAAAEAAR